MILALVLLLLPGNGATATTTNPRLKLSFHDLRMRHGLRTYELERSCCYDTLLLDEERGRLFVGGKNYLASLSLDNISKQDKKIYWPAPVEWREECNWAGKDINDRLNITREHVLFLRKLFCLPLAWQPALLGPSALRPP